MADTHKTGAETNADEIAEADATESGARGSVNSEKDADAAAPPPPLPK